jgi:hypothetical protein
MYFCFLFLGIIHRYLVGQEEVHSVILIPRLESAMYSYIGMKASNDYAQASSKS